jgi:hypothetical protein
MTEGISNIKIEYYSFGYIFRKWANIPMQLPLYLDGQHGILFSDSIPENKRNLIYLAHCERAKKIAKAAGYKVVRTGHPYLMYRILNKVQLKSERSGSVYFYPHSTYQHLSIVDDYETINLLVNNVPREYQPVSICFYYRDLEYGRDKIYRDNGFSCISFGHPLDINFVKNLYDMLCKTKLVIDDSLGSHVYYAVNLGLPVLRIREMPFYKEVNKGDDDLNDIYNMKYYISFNQVLPVGLKPVQSPELMTFVNKELGADNLISPSYLKLTILFEFIKKSIIILLSASTRLRKLMKF